MSSDLFEIRLEVRGLDELIKRLDQLIKGQSSGAGAVAATTIASVRRSSPLETRDDDPAEAPDIGLSIGDASEFAPLVEPDGGRAPVQRPRIRRRVVSLLDEDGV